jgi:hypothetical protein
MVKESKKSKAFRYGFTLVEGGLLGGVVITTATGHPELAAELGETALGGALATTGILSVLGAKYHAKQRERVKNLKKVV